MNIIIEGGGKVGVSLAELLSGEGHSVTVIDTAPKLIETIVNDLDVIGYCGNGASFPVQSEAGVEKCDVFIAVTGSDELNIMSCLVAEKMGAKHSVARVRNPEYSLQVDLMSTQLGIDLVINPDFEAANEISRMLEYPAASKVETFARGRVELAEITVTADSPMVGKALYELKRELHSSLLICAVQRGEDVIIPSGGFVIMSGDTVHFTAPKFEISKIFHSLGMKNRKLKNILLIGGSRISYYLSKYLVRAGKKVRLIEPNMNRATELEANLEGVSVLCADGTDTDVLDDCGIASADALVALTDIDEENMIVSMYAANQNVQKTVCKVTRPALVKMLPAVTKNCSVLYPQNITASMILRYIRAVNNSSGSGIQTLYRILDGKAEAAEYIASADCKLCDIPLRDLKLRENVLIASVSHKKTVIIPDGNTVISPCDSVIVITAGHGFSDLDDILL